MDDVIGSYEPGAHGNGRTAPIGGAFGALFVVQGDDRIDLRRGSRGQPASGGGGGEEHGGRGEEGGGIEGDDPVEKRGEQTGGDGGGGEAQNQAEDDGSEAAAHEVAGDGARFGAEGDTQANLAGAPAQTWSGSDCRRGCGVRRVGCSPPGEYTAHRPSKRARCQLPTADAATFTPKIGETIDDNEPETAVPIPRQRRRATRFSNAAQCWAHASQCSFLDCASKDCPTKATNVATKQRDDARARLCSRSHSNPKVTPRLAASASAQKTLENHLTCEKTMPVSALLPPLAHYKTVRNKAMKVARHSVTVGLSVPLICAIACGDTDSGGRPEGDQWEQSEPSNIIPPETPDTSTGDGQDTGTGTPIPPDNISLLRVTAPSEDDYVVEIDLIPHTLTLDFIANAEWTNGVIEDITEHATFEAENPAVGWFEGNVLHFEQFTEPGIHVTQIRARYVKDGVEYTNPDKTQLTVAAYRQSGDELDFFFILPFDDGVSNKPEAQPKPKPLRFSTDVKALDVFFAMDTTLSMGEEIENLQTALGGQIITELQTQIPNTQFGVGAIEDFPVKGEGEKMPYGEEECDSNDEADQPFDLLQVITADAPEVQKAVNALANSKGKPIGCGYDLPESIIEGIYQIATGEGLLAGPGATDVPADPVGFREKLGAMPVIVPMTDAMSHAPGDEDCGDWTQLSYKAPVDGVAHTRDDMYSALEDICARVVTIASVPVSDDGTETNPDDACGPVVDGAAHATETGALVPPSIWGPAADRPAECAENQCCTGIAGSGVAPNADGQCPLVFRVSMLGEGLGESIVTGLQMLTLYAPFDVNTELTGEPNSVDGVPLPGGKTSADFIQSIKTDGFEDQPFPELPDPTPNATDDGFLGVTPGTTVKFVVTGYNNFLEQTEDPQIFSAKIKVSAGHCIDLDELDVQILVPPIPYVPE